MRSIQTNSLKGGEVLAKSLYDEDGRALLKSGTVLRSVYIAKFIDMGIEYLYIEDGDSEGIEVEDVITEQTREQGKAEIRKVFKDYVVSDRLELTKIYELVNNILDEILNNNQTVLNIADIKGKNQQIYEHCMSVCVLATSVGAYVFDAKKLKELTLGTIVHDFGLMFIPEEILDKPDKLTPEEFELVKTHPKLGYDVLGNDPTFPLIAKNIVYMHHEKLDGSGYPLGVGSRQIHDVTKLVTVCDMFDAMVTPKTYRRQMKTYECFETLTSLVGTQLDKKMFYEFEKHVALFPVGKGVLLSNGYKGIVAVQNNAMLSRPVVRVLYDDKGQKLDPIYDIDLTKELTLFIMDVVEV